MSIRPLALRWLANNHQIHAGAVSTSKFYSATLSWTKQNAWGLQISPSWIMSQSNGNIHLICEAGQGSNNFYYLRVPVAFITTNINGLHRRSDGRISLFLSAAPATLFQDERGLAKLNFSLFVVPAPQPVLTSDAPINAPTETE